MDIQPCIRWSCITSIFTVFNLPIIKILLHDYVELIVLSQSWHFERGKILEILQAFPVTTCRSADVQ